MQYLEISKTTILENYVAYAIQGLILVGQIHSFAFSTHFIRFQ